MTIAGWRFRDPESLALLVLVLAVAVLVALRGRSSRGGLLFSSLALLPPLRRSWRMRRG